MTWTIAVLLLALSIGRVRCWLGWHKPPLSLGRLMMRVVCWNCKRCKKQVFDWN